MSIEEIIPNERLKRARYQKGWTQAELAEKVGTTFETVSRWERGIKAPNAYYRRKLCEVLDKTAEELGLLADPSAFPIRGASPCLFLSSAYADAEHKFVVSLKTELQTQGVTIWSSRTIRRQETRNKRNVLQEAIRAAQVVLLIVSPNTQTSHHVQDTLRLARHFRRPVCAVWIAGEFLQECLPQEYGEPYATIDARKGNDQLLRDKIVATLEQAWLTQIAPETSELSESMWKVPTTLKPLIGREEELARLRELLLGHQADLVTLLGPGGIGKTHLGLQAAMEMRKRFADGVCFVSLAAISDPRLVVPAIAKELGIREVGEYPLFEQLKVALRNRHLLLFLDNFEQVLKAASELAELLAECRQLKKELFGGRIDVGHVIVQQSFAFRGVERTRIGLPRNPQLLTAREVGDFNRRQAAIENPEIVHLAALESGIAKTVTDGQLRLAALIGDVLAQFVANDLGLGRRAVEENTQAGGATGSIVGECDVHPLIGRESDPGAHFE